MSVENAVRNFILLNQRLYHVKRSGTFFIIAGVFTAAALGLAIVTMPASLLLLPLLAVFYLPIYLPFLLSFTIKAHEWRGLKWSLRIASIAAFSFRALAMLTRPDFGNDMAGSFAGAGYNLTWTWVSGGACAFVAVVIGLLLRGLQSRRISVIPERE